jgi:type IV secretory pathway VirB3-like protein
MREPSNDPNSWYFPPVLGLSLIPVVSAVGVAVILSVVNSLRTGELTIPLLAMSFASVGVVLLFLARLPLYRQRRFFAFGSRLLDEPHRRLYRWAYRFLCLGGFLNLLTLFALS